MKKETIHICKKSVMKNNFKESLRNVELKQKKIISSLLKDFIKTKSEANSQLSRIQGGKPLRVTGGSVKKP